MDAHISLRIVSLILAGLGLISPLANAGYIGGAQTFNTATSFDHQDDGFRLDFGANITPWLDLEWNLIDYGYSTYDDPDFVLADPSDLDDADRYENIGFGSQVVNEQKAQYIGITKLRTRAVSAGLKFKKPMNNWLQVYARTSFMAWHAESHNVSIYQARPAYDQQGDALPDPNDTTNANNLNPCNTLSYCRIVDTKERNTWAVDVWYGLGALFQPFSWLAVRTEYSVVNLNAVEFPGAALEGLSIGLELQY